MPQPTIALLTDRRYEAPSSAAAASGYVANILLEDRLVGDALRAHGFAVERVDWARREFDWSRMRAAVFRTTWDYFERFDEFMAWLPRAASATELWNPPELVRWNVDKRYLSDLELAGVPIVPTLVVPRGTREPLAAIARGLDCHELVVKPAVSGAGRHTYRIAKDRLAEFEPRFAELSDAEDMLVQPFVADIVVRGEVTLMVVDGSITHAVRKVARAGEFRVQDDHGGSVHAYTAEPAQIELALRAFAACASPPLYGRVDMVRDAAGVERIMELELIEPEMWFRTCPPAAERLAAGLARRLA